MMSIAVRMFPADSGWRAIDSIADWPIFPIPQAAARAAIPAPIAPAIAPQAIVEACNKIAESNIVLLFLVVICVLPDAPYR